MNPIIVRLRFVENHSVFSFFLFPSIYIFLRKAPNRCFFLQDFYSYFEIVNFFSRVVWYFTYRWTNTRIGCITFLIFIEEFPRDDFFWVINYCDYDDYILKKLHTVYFVHIFLEHKKIGGKKFDFIFRRIFIACFGKISWNFL
jgi:hypothetical protein